jgi:hypothetical protein
MRYSKKQALVLSPFEDFLLDQMQVVVSGMEWSSEDGNMIFEEHNSDVVWYRVEDFIEYWEQGADFDVERSLDEQEQHYVEHQKQNRRNTPPLEPRETRRQTLTETQQEYQRAIVNTEWTLFDLQYKKFVELRYITHNGGDDDDDDEDATCVVQRSKQFTEPQLFVSFQRCKKRVREGPLSEFEEFLLDRMPDMVCYIPGWSPRLRNMVDCEKRRFYCVDDFIELWEADAGRDDIERWLDAQEKSQKLSLEARDVLRQRELEKHRMYQRAIIDTEWTLFGLYTRGLVVLRYVVFDDNDCDNAAYSYDSDDEEEGMQGAVAEVILPLISKRGHKDLRGEHIPDDEDDAVATPMLKWHSINTTRCWLCALTYDSLQKRGKFV